MRLNLLCAVLLVAVAALAAPWCATPLAQWTDGVSYEAIDTIKPPYGAWTETTDGLVAGGLVNRWSTKLLPGDQGNASNIKVTFTIQSSSAQNRVLPDGCYRWGFYWGENYPGWDFGVVTRYQDPLNFYRIQLSATRGELALWDATGGFLQIVPCPVKLNQQHTLTITTIGARFSTALDGTTVLNYWDRSAPLLKGRVGLAVWKSKTLVNTFSATPLRVRPSQAPAYKPTFRAVTEGDKVVIYDNDEPISIYHRDARTKTLFHGAVKLKPGWRPSYYTPIGPVMQDPVYAWPPFYGTFPDDFKVEGNGTDALTCTFATGHDDKAVTKQTCRIEYEATRGMYSYTYDATTMVMKDQQLHAFEVTDPLEYNNREPGPEVTHKWNPTGHRWWLVTGPDGAWQRFPLLDYLSGDNNGEMCWENAVSLIWPDPIAVPAFEVSMRYPQVAGRKLIAGLCMWGYDYHHTDSGAGLNLKKGEVRPYRVRLTAWTPAEADKAFKASTLTPVLRKDSERYAIFNPKGTTFAETTTKAEAKHTMIASGTVDTTIGRTDKASLRVDSPGSAGVFLYQYAIEQHAARWWIRGWIKTRGLRGRGVQLSVKYAYGKEPEDLFYLGGLGTRDWTYFSFITTAPRVRDCTSITFDADGPGQVWLDDLAFSALKEGEEPKTTTFARPEGLEPRADLLIDLAMADQPTTAAYDESRNGHALYLNGPTWMREEGRGFLRFDGTDDTASLPLKSILEPRDPPPGTTGAEIYKPVFRLDAFTYECWARPRLPARPAVGTMMLFHYRFNPQISFDQLTAKPGECRFTYQNDRFRGEQIRFQQTVPYDQWLHVVATHGDGKVTLYLNGEKAEEAAYDPKASPGFAFFAYHWRYDVGSFLGSNRWYTGDLGPLRLYTRALTAEEVKQQYQTGWPKVY
ncbi:MAG: hypothetical protein BWY76_00550 [bacterium ADurb.Bin429]|nr:MAG: hypothetical protein BWY76_00550 [bacterium ADurb.Bin429]